MKRIFAFFLLVLVTLSVMLSLSSCQSVEDIKGVRQTESILKTNYYETVIFTEKKELETIGAADHLKSFLTAENKKGEKIMICYCKTAAAADTVLVEFEKMADESDDELIYEKNDKTVFLGTKKALKCATKKIWVNQLKQTFIEENNYKYVIEGLGNTLLITLGALVIGVILGVLIAVAKYYSEDNPKLKFVNFLCDLYTMVIRGIPITVLLLIFFFVIMGVSPSKKTFFSYIGTNSSYVYALHRFFIVFLRDFDAGHDILRVLTNKWLLLAYCFSGIPMSFILASKPVRKLTSFFVEPKFDIKKIIKTIIE